MMSKSIASVIASRPVWYVESPVRPDRDDLYRAAAELPIEVDAVEILALAYKRNIENAVAWLRWLQRHYPEAVFIAPWLVGLLAGADDSDPQQRNAALADCLAVVPRCTGIVMVGGRVGSGGQAERTPARRVIDLTHLGRVPPNNGTYIIDWKEVS